MIIAGTLLTNLAGNYLLSDKRVNWGYLGKPPEPPTRIINTYQGFLIESASGVIYENCGEDCWTVDTSSGQVEVEEFNCPSRNPPELPELVSISSFCTPWGVGMIYTSYGLTEDGALYEWERRRGEWDGFLKLLLPYIGGLFFLIVGVIIVSIKAFSDYLARLGSRYLESKNLEE
jgi:hypothetical protein